MLRALLLPAQFWGNPDPAEVNCNISLNLQGGGLHPCSQSFDAICQPEGVHLPGWTCQSHLILSECTQQHQNTESQNHRMVGVERDLCGSSGPTPLPKQGRLQQAAQDLVQVGLEYLQRRRNHNLPGQPVPGLCHPQREEALPHVQMELPLLQFVPVAPCPAAGHH